MSLNAAVVVAIEYAKSARSACKQCRQVLMKGEMRVGDVSKAPGGFDMIRWHHPHCFFNNLTLSLDLEKCSGYKALKPSDQLHLKHLFAQSSEHISQKSPKRLKKDEQTLTDKPNPKITYDPKTWDELLCSFSVSKLSSSYRGAELPAGWKSFASVICGKVDIQVSGDKIAAFDFDGCLVKTSVQRVGAHAWSLLYPSIPEKLKQFHEEGYKLVIFTNESNIDRWKNSRQKAVDSKLGRLQGFMELVKVPVQVFVACAKEGCGDTCRKPSPGMWQLMERCFNDGIAIERSNSFYVGDAAGRDGDHSDADLGFAKSLGLPFRVPEEVFKS